MNTLFRMAWLACLALFACSGSVVNESRLDAPVRGVWLTNVASSVLDSRENIREAIKECKRNGINTIFVVTWNRGYTLYPSEVLKAVTNTAIDPRFAGRDPLQEVIEEAHKESIAVHAWFEFGFSSSYRDSTGGPLLAARPGWASRDKDGRITEKNGFLWMNAFDPDVQEFITALVLEVVNTYDVDGIQGDDRLPALPANGGYDSLTRSLYRSEHNGMEPPSNASDTAWVNWRASRLNRFLGELSEKVRNADPEVVISMAPSIYPWSKENYLQDWPEWIARGYVDWIIPQVYRYDYEKYEREMEKILNEQLGAFPRSRLFPGILLQVDDYNAPAELVRKKVAFNRRNGVNGEVFFFYEGIRKYDNLFKEIYEQ